MGQVMSSGKTTIALQAITEYQRRGGVVEYVDTEHVLDLASAQRMGVTLERRPTVIIDAIAKKNTHGL
jgi:RecA/RadA recombinase